MQGLTEDEIARFSTAFYSRDLGEGVLSVTHLQQWLQGFDSAIPNKALQTIVSKFNSGGLDLRGVLMALASEVPIPSTKEDLEIAFKAFDKDGSGSISKGELKQLLKGLEHHPTEEDLADILQEMDKDGDGEINYEEFVSAVMRK